MEISILLMEQITELFLMILMGYIIVKTGLLKGDDSKVISKIVLYLVIPCVIINAFQVDYTSEKVKELLLVFAASVLLQVILLAAVWGVGKVLKLNEVEMTSIYYSNSGNLICTEKSKEIIQEGQKLQQSFVEKLFEGMDEDTRKALQKGMAHMEANIEKMLEEKN